MIGNIIKNPLLSRVRDRCNCMYSGGFIFIETILRWNINHGWPIQSLQFTFEELN